MMMNKKFLLPLLMTVALFLVSCDKDDDPIVTNPFDDQSESSDAARSKIVVISDLHMGNDLVYSENVKHLDRLEQFLKEVRASETIKELVLGGDILDEWYVPTRIDTYGSGTQADFVRKSVEANKDVFDVLNGIIRDGHIKVTYLPGNHDMGFLPEQINIAMPGVNQARDAGERYPVGTYSPDGFPQIAIEHGHRYDFFCAITPGANESEAPGSIMPPDYFFARIAANSFVNPTTQEAATKVPLVTLHDPGNAEQRSKYVYYNLWKKVMEEVIYVNDSFSDPIITTNIGNFTKSYAINDILPRNNASDGNIEMDLYNGLFTQENWDARQRYNNVSIVNHVDSSIVGSLKTAFINDQADVQYFRNSESKVRLVIFGHTHIPMMKSHTNLQGEKCLYVNSGSWEDRKTRDQNASIDQDAINMHFVVIDPLGADKKTLQVSLYQYKYGTHSLEEVSVLDL